MAATRATRRVRCLVAGLLVGLACVALLASTIGIWTHRSVLNTAVWAKRVGPLATEPAVKAAVVAALTNQVMELVQPQQLFERALPDKAEVLAVPLASVVRGYVDQKVTAFVGSAQFERLWAAATLQAHRDAIRLVRGEASGVQVARGRIALNLLPVLNRLLVGLSDESPGILGAKASVPVLQAADLPADFRAKLAKALGHPIREDFGIVTVYDGDGFAAVQRGVELFDRAVVAFVGLTFLCAGLALVASTRRRRTGLQLVVGGVVVFVLVRRLVHVVIAQALGQIKPPLGHDAAEVVLHTFLDPLVRGAGYGGLALLAVALVLVVTGPYLAVRRARRSVAALGRKVRGAVVGGMGEVPDLAWVGSHAGLLEAVGWVAAVLGLWFLDLSWLGILLLAIALAAYRIVLARLVQRASLPAAALD